MNSPIPPPVDFSIDAAQSARLREILFATGGARMQHLASALVLLLVIFSMALQARTLGWQNPLVIVPAMLYVANFALLLRGTFERCTVRPVPATTVTFDETGLSIERIGTTQAAQIPFARIRSVRLTPDIIAVCGIWTTYLTIPTSALPDGGIQVLDFLRDRIVSKGMPDDSSHGVTTIFNSVSPVLARR